jgi:hypothetical protein
MPGTLIICEEMGSAHTLLLQNFINVAFEGDSACRIFKVRSEINFCKAGISSVTLCEIYVMVVDTGIPTGRCQKN